MFAVSFSHPQTVIANPFVHTVDNPSYQLTGEVLSGAPDHTNGVIINGSSSAGHPTAPTGNPDYDTAPINASSTGTSNPDYDTAPVNTNTNNPGNPGNPDYDTAPIITNPGNPDYDEVHVNTSNPDYAEAPANPSNPDYDDTHANTNTNIEPVYEENRAVVMGANANANPLYEANLNLGAGMDTMDPQYDTMPALTTSGVGSTTNDDGAPNPDYDEVNFEGAANTGPPGVAGNPMYETRPAAGMQGKLPCC